VTGVIKLIFNAQIVQEYERAIIFRLGRALRVPRGPGNSNPAVTNYLLDLLLFKRLRFVTEENSLRSTLLPDCYQVTVASYAVLTSKLIS
jgi:hypothetical protein